MENSNDHDQEGMFDEEEVREEWVFLQDVSKDVDNVEEMREELPCPAKDTNSQKGLKVSDDVLEVPNIHGGIESSEDAPKAPERICHAADPVHVFKNIDYIEHPEGYIEYPIDGPGDAKTFFFKKGVNHLGYYFKSKDKKNRTVKYKRYILFCMTFFCIESLAAKITVLN